MINRGGDRVQLARTWAGTRSRERQIKRQGGLSRCCPDCGVRPASRAVVLMTTRTREQIAAAWAVLDAIDDLVRVQLASRGLTGPAAKANVAEYWSVLSVYDRAASQLRDVVGGDEVDDCDTAGLAESANGSSRRVVGDGQEHDAPERWSWVGPVQPARRGRGDRPAAAPLLVGAGTAGGVAVVDRDHPRRAAADRLVPPRRR